jgi:NitT/TauT family transport system substrate-binding protein
MPTLLASGQIDGYIAWQPFVEVVPMTGIGKVLSYTGDLPPQGAWKDHPCCVLTVRKDLRERNPEIVTALTAVTILSTQYINEHPAETADIVADWLAGKQNFTYGTISVSSVDAMHRAIGTIKFANDPTDRWQEGILKFMYTERELGLLSGTLTAANDTMAKELLFNTQPYGQARTLLAQGRLPAPKTEQRQLGIGYLVSDHHSSLFVAVKNWEYFNDTYRIALRPRDPSQSRPEIVDLIIDNEKIAEFRLVPGDFGGQLMQLMATDLVQFSYVGNPPAISTIDKGTPIEILMGLNNEGSGVVVSRNSPADNWTSFVAWARARDLEGKPLVIANPGKGSIQDILLRNTMKTLNIQVNEV